MLTLTARQMEALRQRFRAKGDEPVVDEILGVLRAHAPDVIARYPESSRFVRETLAAARTFGVNDFDQVVNWCLIRFLTNTQFYNAPDWSAVLNHPFLPPFARGRHPVLAFFAIRKLKGEG